MGAVGRQRPAALQRRLKWLHNFFLVVATEIE
jgi:hypothetical protein